MKRTSRDSNGGDADGDFLRIDPMRLDEEWLAQPELYFKFSKKLADARKKLDAEKSALDVERAELDADIRRRPKKYKLEKITEGAINALIPKVQSYRDQYEAMLAAKHRVDVLSAAVTAIEHRKRALTNLVELWLANYFAEPRNSGLSPDSKSEVAQRARLRKRKKHVVRRTDDSEE